jgi:histidine ammonia-lyase
LLTVDYRLGTALIFFVILPKNCFEMIVIGGRDICLEDFQRVLFDGEKVELDQDALREAGKNFLFLKEFSKEKIIYGINTGLGPMSQYKVCDEDRKSLQYNLIRSHASGSGERLSDINTRALMLARLNTLMKGYSGIHTDAMTILKEILNRQIIPYIPSHGGVGASGDLIQLAHLALVMIGEGEIAEGSQRIPTAEVFRKHKIQPLEMHIREALSLINGTSAMSGIGMVNVILSYRLLYWSLLASSLINEIVESYDDHFSLALNHAKLHFGQRFIAEEMNRILADSQLVRKREEYLFNGQNGETIFSKKIQEYYSLRCITQILGPVLDTIRHTEKVIVDEINSVNDNPVIDHRKENVYHGGNFHGDYVALEMDKLKLAITKLSILTERQLNFLMNDKLNNRLAPFVNRGILGLNLGMQGMQFTATSNVAENQMLSNPMYVHSIPTNNDNQDVVSMGTNAALITMKVVHNSFEVMAIHLMALLQAIDHLKISGNMSSATKEVYDELREFSPGFEEDGARYDELENMINYISRNGKITLP